MPFRRPCNDSRVTACYGALQVGVVLLFLLDALVHGRLQRLIQDVQTACNNGGSGTALHMFS